MYIKVTLPFIKKAIKEKGFIEINMAEKGKDFNHFMTFTVQSEWKSLEDIEKGQAYFQKCTGKNILPQYAIWEDEE